MDANKESLGSLSKLAQAAQDLMRCAGVDEALWRFSGLDEFYDELLPVSPLGLDFHRRRVCWVNESSLEMLYRFLRDVASFWFSLSETEQATTLSFLGSLLRLPEDFSLLPEVSDLLAVKRLCVAFVQVQKLLPPALLEFLEFPSSWPSEFSSYFLQTLPSSCGVESFKLESSWSVDLAQARQALNQKDKEIFDHKKQLVEFIYEKTGLNFLIQTHEFYEFLVVSTEKISTLQNYAEVLVWEPLDRYTYRVSLRDTPELSQLKAERMQLLEAEKSAERALRTHLGKLVRKHWACLQAAARGLAWLDWALARVRWQVKEGALQPQWSQEQFLIQEGKWIPLWRKLGEKYEPLSLELSRRILVIFGSNMGGKTVVLRSILSYVFMAQLGFGVVAKAAVLPVFDSFFGIGIEGRQMVSGLSSFGYEVFYLQQSIEKMGNRSLFLLDEVGRATHVREARALIGGIIEFFKKRSNIWAFFSTHVGEWQLDLAIQYARMGGLRTELVQAEYKNISSVFQQQKEKKSLDALLEKLNTFMDYRLYLTTHPSPAHDALEISRFLGLEPEILAYAQKFCFTLQEQE